MVYAGALSKNTPAGPAQSGRVFLVFWMRRRLPTWSKMTPSRCLTRLLVISKALGFRESAGELVLSSWSLGTCVAQKVPKSRFGLKKGQ